MDDRVKNIRIHIPAGVRRGIKSITITNWTGQMFICQREQIKHLEHYLKEGIQRQGIYILFNQHGAQRKPDVYIGEAENVINRLRGHIRNKDFWEKVFIFTNQNEDINKTHFKYIESCMVDLAKNTDEVNLTNGNLPQQPSLSRFDKDMMDEYLDHAIILLETLGFSYLQPGKKKRLPRRATEKSNEVSNESLQQRSDRSPTREKNIVGRKKYQSSEEPSRSTTRLPKIRDIFAAGLMKTGDEIWFKRTPDRKAILTLNGKCRYGGREMSLAEYAKSVSGWIGVNIYDQLHHGPSGKIIRELRNELMNSPSDALPRSISPERPVSPDRDYQPRSVDRNTKPVKTPRTPSHTGLPRVKDIFAAGLMKAGDEIWFKRTPDRRAILTASGKCEYEGREMSLLEYGKIVSRWETINIYQFFIHGPSGSLIGELRNRLSKPYSDIKSKSIPIKQPVSIAENPRSTDPISGIRLYFDKPMRGIKAQGIHSTDGFFVLAGSSATQETKVYSMASAYHALREKLIARGAIELRDDRLYFTQDVRFKSPSTAATVISGTSQNGRIVWKDKDGKTLKEIQQESS